MDRIQIAELMYENQIVGYRLTVYGTPTRYDFNADLLDFVYNRGLKYANNFFVGKPLDGYIEDGRYTTYSLDATELKDEYDIINNFDDSSDFGNDFNLTNLIRYRYLVCRKMLLDIGIPLGVVEDVSVNGRLSACWGRCSRRKYGTNTDFKIEISEVLAVNRDFDCIDNTMIHELLHTCDGCFNHSAKWKYYAKVVCSHYGYNITRISSAEEKGVDVADLISKGYYACQCTGCGEVVTRKSECDFIKYPERYTCGRCKGSFIRVS